jgi:hypothetical protein
MDDRPKDSTDSDFSVTEINQLLTAASQGDVSVLPALREFLDGRPDVWQKAGDLAAHAREAIIQMASGTNLLGAESLQRTMQQLHDELLGGSVDPLERMLVERCVVCWATMNLAELSGVERERQGVRQGTVAQKQINVIQNRFLNALKSLATLRKLLKPSSVPTLRVVSPPSVA